MVRGQYAIAPKLLADICRDFRGQYSRFFRPHVFETVLPRVRRLAATAKLKRETLKLAVVGCAAGEEVYSLAMALTQTGLGQSVKLAGIDRDPQMLISAAQGRYSYSYYGGRSDFFNNVPRAYRAYFKSGPNTALVSPEIKKQVGFKLADASKEEFLGKVDEQDAIVLNNVLVHAMPEERAAIIDNIADRIKPGGILIVDETVEHPSLTLSSTNGPARIYVKK